MAMENPRIKADVVEIQEFPLLSQRFNITGVPKTVINNRVQFVGAASESVFVDKVLEAAGVPLEERQVPSLSAAQELGPSTKPSEQQVSGRSPYSAP